MKINKLLELHLLKSHHQSRITRLTPLSPEPVEKIRVSIKRNKHTTQAAIIGTCAGSYSAVH